MTDPFDAVRALRASGERGVLATPLDGSPPVAFDAGGNVLAGGEPPAVVITAAGELSTRGVPDVVSADGVDWFVEPVLPAPRLIVLGAIAVADALVPMAAAAGMDVEVVDPRPWLADPARHPTAVAVHCGEPAAILAGMNLDPGTAVVSFLHEPRREDPVLRIALESRAGYVGAMGSRRTTAAKRERLIRSGLAPGVVDRLHAPIGIDLGSVTPQEIAVSVLAEVVATHRGLA